MITNLLEQLFTMGKIGRRLVIYYYIKKESGVWKSKTLRKFFKKHYDIDVGLGSYGWESIDFKGPAVIGKYCSFGPGIKRFEKNHLVSYATTHPCVFSPSYGWIKEDFRKATRLNIGHDVWIGANVIILPSVTTIGTGSVIAAGAVLSKNVPPYEIWGGIPAKKIKARFDNKLSDELLKTQWWDVNESILAKHIDSFESPEKLLSLLKNLKT